MADDCDFLGGDDLDAILDMLEADEGVEEAFNIVDQYLLIEWFVEAIRFAISCALRPSVLEASKFQCLSTFYKIHNRESNSFHQA